MHREKLYKLQEGIHVSAGSIEVIHQGKIPVFSNLVISAGTYLCACGEGGFEKADSD